MIDLGTGTFQTAKSCMALPKQILLIRCQCEFGCYHALRVSGEEIYTTQVPDRESDIFVSELPRTASEMIGKVKIEIAARN